MGPGERLHRWWRSVSGPGGTGHPTSANGASSFHLWWRGLTDEPLVEVSVDLEVVVGPAVAELYFWALQASFVDGPRRLGAAHLGLQWHPAHHGSTAVNWGGYDPTGAELSGPPSSLPSATGNPNTRDMDWRSGHPYRLAIVRGGQPGAWVGSVDGTPVRALAAAGSSLADVVVWCEAFARCDHPATVVRWSHPAAVTASGRTVHPDGVVVSYQSRADGGCDNTTVRFNGGGVEQVTNAARAVAPGAVLAF